jgi:UDP-N-acetylmuramyl pentapeptide synthase
MERFGSWEKIIQAKTEIRDMQKWRVLIANGSDETVKQVVGRNDVWRSGQGADQPKWSQNDCRTCG